MELNKQIAKINKRKGEQLTKHNIPAHSQQKLATPGMRAVSGQAKRGH